jgi:ATP-dependent helicase/nuclease subunit B
MPQRVFLGWNRPFLPLAIDWLWERGAELPGMLVVVPTAQAGRRLREALAERGACLAPRVVTPEEFFRVAGDETVAAEVEERLAWIETLRELQPGETSALFPVEPVERSFSWAAGVAGELENVRDELEESGKTYADVADASPETERWNDLVTLEQRMLARLEGWGKIDRAKAKRRRAESYQPPAGTRRIVIAAVPDPVPLTETAWRMLEGRGFPIEVLIHAPQEEAEHFDVWGWPDDEAQAWTKRPTPVCRERVHLTASAPELGAAVVRQCAGKRSEEISIGLCDAGFAPAVEAAFEQAGWKAWNPEGRLAGTSMALLLTSLAAWVRLPDRWDRAAEILRNPMVGQVIERTDWFGALKALDELEACHLPGSPSRVRDLIEWKQREREEAGKPSAHWETLRFALEWADGWRRKFSKGEVGKALAEWAQSMRRQGVDDGAEGKWLDQLEATAETIAGLEARGLLKAAGDALDLALGTLAPLRTASGREDAVIDLLGWLELAYEPAEHLVLAGFHEGCVPDGSLDHGFLPDSVKTKLGLRDAAARFARDAYLFHALAASRRVEVVVAKVDPHGEPRRPSRLLLVAQGVELAERVRAVFGELEGKNRRLAGWDRGEWKLAFAGEPQGYFDHGRMLSPSALKDYLHCPFRFYLKRVLGWERTDCDKVEMDALDFGNLCHGALEALGRDLPDSEDVAEVRDFLVAEIEKGLQRFGSPLSLPLMVQRETAIARLSRFAEKEVAHRLEGWRTVHVELKIDENRPWAIDGQPVKMQIDRIDFHQKEGWLVLDYKSSGKAVAPQKAHLHTADGNKRRLYGEALDPGKGRPLAWKNLQLPLYAAYVQRHLNGGKPVQAAYVNLPVALNEVGFSPWENFDEAMLESAMEWARGAVHALRQKVHWPPVELTGAEAAWDEFAPLAPDGLANAVDGSLIESLKAIAETYDEERSVACI